MKKHPLVSVVITTKNEAANIANCLQSVIKQTYRNLEIIVVDNHSTDQTCNLAKKYTKLVFTKGPERSVQRNYGFSKARGEYFVYLDADMVMSQRVVDSCLKTIKHDPDTVALYIPEIVTGSSYWSRVRRFERSFYNATVIDCVRFLKASAFKAVHGFDISMTGPEDWDFDKKIRLRGKVSLITEPIYHNESDINLRRYLTKKAYYAQSFKKYIKKWGKDDPDIRKQFSILYRYLVVFTEKGKWRRLISSPHLFIGVILLRFLVGITYLKTRLTR